MTSSRFVPREERWPPEEEEAMAKGYSLKAGISTGPTMAEWFEILAPWKKQSRANSCEVKISERASARLLFPHSHRA